MLECEHVSSQLMALGLLVATAGTSSAFFLVKVYFFHVIFEVTISLFVSL
jgi:hypothetical protein